MKTSELLENLRSDAKLLDSGKEPSVKHFLRDIEDTLQSPAGTLRNGNLTIICYRFHDYILTHDWLSELSSLDIDVDMAGRLSIPSQWFENACDPNHAVNPFYLAELRLLLTTLLYDDVLERAFAAESLKKLCKDREPVSHFFEAVYTVIDDLPCHCAKVTEDTTGNELYLSFCLELARITADFASEYPQYGIGDPGEFGKMLEEEFDGKDPGRGYTKAVTQRLLRTVCYLLESPDDD